MAEIFRPGTTMLDNSTWFIAGGNTPMTWIYTVDGGFEVNRIRLYCTVCSRFKDIFFLHHR